MRPRVQRQADSPGPEIPGESEDPYIGDRHERLAAAYLTFTPPRRRAG
jgi:hypothetical protein